MVADSEYKKYVLEWSSGDGYTFSCDEFIIIEAKSQLDIEHFIFEAVIKFEEARDTRLKRMEIIEGHRRHEEEYRNLLHNWPEFKIDKLDLNIDYEEAACWCKYRFPITEFDEWVKSKTIRID